MRVEKLACNSSVRFVMSHESSATKKRSQIFALLAIASILVNDVHAKHPQRLIGGSDAAPGEIVFQASLRLDGKHHCGGALVSTRHVLTAAHCVVNLSAPYRNLVVVTGTNDLDKGGQETNVDDIEVHEEFAANSDATWTHDIAVLTLVRDVDVNTYQSPIGLPQSDTKDHVVALMSGWGYTSYDDFPDGQFSTILQKSEMAILSRRECQHLHKLNTIGDENICGFKNSFSGLCKGDDGSPLVYNGTLIGIASWYYPCGLGFPDVFTNVYHYLGWILNHMSTSFYNESH